MFREIQFLDSARVTELRRIAAAAPFADGRITNPHSKVKQNLQLHDEAAYQQSAGLLARAVMSNEEFLAYAFPAKIAPPLLTRYEPGMRYGAHSDSALINAREVGLLRSDLSCTIFLSEPADYEGGALVVQLGSAKVRFKLQPGFGIVYPSTTLHEVEPVKRGERLAAVTFIQSCIPEQNRRDMLFELNEIAALEGLKMTEENFTRLQLVRDNLLRHWTDKP